MGKFTMRMRIVLALLCIAGVIAWSAFLKPLQIVKSEAFAVLEQMQKAGIQRLDAEVSALDQQLRDIADRELQVAQILPQAERWLAQKKTADYSDVPCG